MGGDRDHRRLFDVAGKLDLAFISPRLLPRPRRLAPVLTLWAAAVALAVVASARVMNKLCLCCGG
jgi:hypothetical protein